jgi:hypothetical protein
MASLLYSDAQMKTWRSDVYKHFKSPPEILVARSVVKYKFSCRSHPYVFSVPLLLNTSFTIVLGQAIQSFMPVTMFPHQISSVMSVAATVNWPLLMDASMSSPMVQHTTRRNFGTLQHSGSHNAIVHSLLSKIVPSIACSKCCMPK